MGSLATETAALVGPLPGVPALCLEELQEVRLNAAGVGGGGVAVHGLPLLVHQELGEVPLDGVNQEARLLVLEVLPERVRPVPVDVHLAEHVELHVELLHKLLYVCLRAGLLTPELVAGKSEDAKTLGLGVLLVKLDELRVVLVGLASLGRHVHDEHHVALVFVQRHLVPVDVDGREVVDGSRVLPVFICRRHYLADR